MASRALWIAGSLLLATPLASLWGHASLPWPVAFAPLLVLLLTAWRPLDGLLVVAAALPISVPLSVTLGPMPFGAAEQAHWWLLPLASGLLLREGLVPVATPTRLAAPAALLGAIIGSSAMVLLAVDQWATSAASTYGADVLRHVARDYFFDPASFAPLHDAALWAAALVVACLTERTCRRVAGAGSALARMTLVGLTAAAAGSWLRLAEISISRMDPVPAALRHLASARISPYLPDVNAAGSLLAFGAVLAMTRLRANVLEPWARGLAATAAGLLTGAVWLTGSRAALAAVVIVGLAVAVRGRLRGARIGALAAVVVTLAVLTFGSMRQGQSDWRASLGVRLDMANIGATLVARTPIFGVGIGQFQRASVPLVDADLVARFPQTRVGENAHNQLLQVLVEWGGLGLAAFLWLLLGGLGPVVRWWQSTAPPGWAAAIGLAWIAFLLTSLLGHPLLQPLVVATLVPALGIVAAEGAVAGSAMPRRILRVGMVLLVVSLPWRVGQARLTADLDETVVGAGPIVGEFDGVRYRLVTSAGTWFVSGSARVVEWPLAKEPNGTAVCRLAITLDGRPANEIDVRADEWTRVRFVVGEGAAGQRTRRLGVQVHPEPCAVRVGTPVLID